MLTYEIGIGEAVIVTIETYLQQGLYAPVVPETLYSLLNFDQNFLFAEALVNDGCGRTMGST